MSEPFIFINTYAIKPGMLDAYKRGFQRTAEVVEDNEPRMLYFACHVSEEGTETTTVQVHADAENMAFHMRLVGDHIEAARKLLDFSSMSIQIYGSPTEAILEQMRQLSGAGVDVTVSRAAIAFDRFPST
jgi:hypothetical protein